jgi:hypothetical protein
MPCAHWSIADVRCMGSGMLCAVQQGMREPHPRASEAAQHAALAQIIWQSSYQQCLHV